MNARSTSRPQPQPPRLDTAYRDAPLDSLLADPTVLAVLGFGRSHPATHPDPRYLHVGLEPIEAHRGRFEVWRGLGPVSTGRDGAVQWAHDGALGFGAIEVDEAAAGGIAAAAEQAYAGVLDFLAGAGQPALLRLWNYFDAITLGEGDDERYRQFSLGRARGMGGRLPSYPAATAIGRLDGRRVLQVYWLTARRPGLAIENPRQVSAWRYPRQYGPRPPSFARATLPADASLPLLLSGTASVLGHASAHPDNLPAQLDETFRNLDALVAGAVAQRPGLATSLGGDSVMKAYVRDEGHLSRVREDLARRLSPGVQQLILHAEICRHELLVEVDGFHR